MVEVLVTLSDSDSGCSWCSGSEDKSSGTEKNYLTVWSVEDWKQKKHLTASLDMKKRRAKILKQKTVADGLDWGEEVDEGEE